MCVGGAGRIGCSNAEACLQDFVIVNTEYNLALTLSEVCQVLKTEFYKAIRYEQYGHTGKTFLKQISYSLQISTVVLRSHVTEEEAEGPTTAWFVLWVKTRRRN